MSAFTFLRKGEALPNGCVLVAEDLQVLEASSADTNEAKQKLRVLVQAKGGNTCLDLEVGRKAGVKVGSFYSSGDAVAFGRAAVIAEKSMSTSEIEEMASRFKQQREREFERLGFEDLFEFLIPFVLVVIAIIYFST